MALVGTAINLGGGGGEEMKTYPQVLTSLIKPQIWVFHFVVLQTTAKKWTNMKHARPCIAWKAVVFVGIQYSLIYTSMFSLTSFPWQCKWENMTSFSLTSVLVQKLAR